ncbi:MAG: hypothetical protein GXP37_12205 [Chloroflexi bacterium]|nr:hypothetical protein [Chloroflexota bacterium]
MNGEILRWNRLGDGRFGVKVRASSMCVGFWNPFRMTGSGDQIRGQAAEHPLVGPKQKLIQNLGAHPRLSIFA